MNLWNEYIITQTFPTVNVKMPDNRVYSGKIITITGNLAKIRIDVNFPQNPHPWHNFWISLSKIADSLNKGIPCVY